MGKSNFAVFVDLENAGGKESMLRSIIEKVKIRGDILLGKVYGYTDRYSDLKQCLLSNTFSGGAVAALWQEPEEQSGHYSW